MLFDPGSLGGAGCPSVIVTSQVKQHSAESKQTNHSESYLNV